MAKRKLKKSVKATITLAGIIFVGGFISSQVEKDEHVMAETTKVAEAKSEPSYIEALEMNEELSQGYTGGVDAFYLYDDGEYEVFMMNDTKEKMYVKKSVLNKSYVSKINVGDNVMLYASDNINIDFVGIESGKSVNHVALTLLDYNDDYTKIVYENESTGDVYNFDKDYIEKNNLDNYANIGSVATGYEYDGEIVAITTGW